MSSNYRVSVMALTLGLFASAALVPMVRADKAPADNPPPQKPEGGPGGGGGPNGGGPGGPGGGVHVIPRFAVEKLNLTEDQKKQIADLEQEVTAKLEKILTPDQMKTLKEGRPPRRGGGGGGGGGGQGGPGGGGQEGPPGGGPDRAGGGGKRPKPPAN